MDRLSLSRGSVSRQIGIRYGITVTSAQFERMQLSREDTVPATAGAILLSCSGYAAASRDHEVNSVSEATTVSAHQPYGAVMMNGGAGHNLPVSYQNHVPGTYDLPGPSDLDVSIPASSFDTVPATAGASSSGYAAASCDHEINSVPDITTVSAHQPYGAVMMNRGAGHNLPVSYQNHVPGTYMYDLPGPSDLDVSIPATSFDTVPATAGAILLSSGYAAASHDHEMNSVSYQPYGAVMMNGGAGHDLPVSYQNHVPGTYDLPGPSDLDVSIPTTSFDADCVSLSDIEPTVHTLPSYTRVIDVAGPSNELTTYTDTCLYILERGHTHVIPVEKLSGTQRH